MKKTNKIKPKAIKPVVKSNIYKATLEMAGIKYEGEGETIFDAIHALKLEWHDIKAKGVLTITHGNHKVEKLFFLKPLRRIFANKLTMRFWAKNLERLLIETAPMK